MEREHRVAPRRIQLSRISHTAGSFGGYVEVKSPLNPQFYLALRAGYEIHHRVEDDGGAQNNHLYPERKSYEFALGYHLNHFQTLKFGYEWLKTNGVGGTRDNASACSSSLPCSLFPSPSETNYAFA